MIGGRFALSFLSSFIYYRNIHANSEVYASSSQIASIHELCLIVQFKYEAKRQQGYNFQSVEMYDNLNKNTHLILSFDSFKANHAIYKIIFLKAVQCVRHFTQDCTIHIHNIDSYSSARTTCDCDWKQFKDKFDNSLCSCDIFQFLGRTFIPLNNLFAWDDVEYIENNITWVFHDDYILPFNEPNILYLWWTTKAGRVVEEHFPLAQYLVEFLFHSLFYSSHFAAVIDGNLHLLCLHCRSDSSNIQEQLVLTQTHNQKQLIDLGREINKHYTGIIIPTFIQNLNNNDRTLLNCMKQRSRPPNWLCIQSYAATSPELRAVYLIGNTLNISFQLNTHWYQSLKTEKSPLLIRLNYAPDGIEERREVYTNFMYRGVILDTFCKTIIPYKFKVFVHTNRTSLSLSTALLSPCENNIWFILITVTIVVCCVMNCVAWKRRENNSFTNAEITFYALSVSLGQFNACFESKCSRRSSVLSTVYSLWTFFMLVFSMHYSGYFLAYLLIRTLPELPTGLHDILTNSKFENVPLFSTGFVMKRLDEDGGYTSFLKAQVLVPRHLYYRKHNLSSLSETYYNLSRRIRDPSTLPEPTFSQQEFFYNLTFNPRRIEFEVYDYLEETGLYAFIEPATILEKYESLALLSKSYERVPEQKTKEENSIDIDPYGKTFYYQKGLCSLSIHKTLSWIDNTGLFQQWTHQFDYLKNLESQRKWSDLLKEKQISPDWFFTEIPPLNFETLQEIFKLCGFFILASLAFFTPENLSRILQKRLPKIFLMASRMGLSELTLSFKSYLNGYSTNRY